MTLLAGCVAAGGAAREGWIDVVGDSVASMGFGAPPGTPDLEHDGLITRGLCDLQLNGAVGVEAADGEAALERIDAALLARGVTSYLPTIVSTSAERATEALDAIARFARDPASPVEGAHLEGPFLSPDFPGAQHRQRLRRPVDGRAPYYDHPAVRMVTVAPELDGAIELIAALAERPGVVVSLGHSGATAGETAEAIAAGARSVTHVFNAMAPLHHRRPGLVGLALTDQRVQLGVIADGHHIDPVVLRLVAQAAGDRVVLVSDAITGAGVGPGRYSVLDIPIIVRPDGRCEGPGGELAGSAVLLDEALRRWCEVTGLGLAQGLLAANERPARLLGLPAAISPGRFADLVLLTAAGRPARVMRRGRWVA